MTDVWAAFPDAPAAASAPPPAVAADPWDAFPDAPSAPAAAPDRGATEAGVNHWANQTLGGFGPQIGGAVQGILDWTGIDQHRGGVDRAAPGAVQPQTIEELAAALKPGGSPRLTPSIGSFGGGYDRFVGNAEGNLATEEAQHPVASAVGDIAGGVTLASMVPAGVAARTLGIAGKAGTMGAKVGKGFAGALTYGAISGAGNAEDKSIGGRIKGGLEGSLVNGVVGAAAPLAIAGAGGVARATATPFRAGARAVRGALNPEQEAARRVTGALGRDLGGDPGRAVTALEQAGKKGVPLIAADMGETSRALGRSAANTSPEGRAVIDQALEARHGTQLDRTESVISRAAPFVDAPAVQEKLDQAALRLKKPAYDKAYQEGDRSIWSPEMERLAGSQAVQDAMKGAVTKGKDRAINEGFGAFNPGVKVTPDGQLHFARGKNGVPTYPNLQFWDYTKRELDDAAKAAARAGRSDEARVVGGLAKKLRTELDVIVPSYAHARGTAMAFFNADDAAEAGRNFVTQRADNFVAAKAAHAKLNPAEQKLFAGNFASTLINKLRETGDRRNIINSIFVSSPAAKERIAVALGPRAVGPMEAHLRFENIMDMTKRRLTGNSTTARQLVELGLAGTVGGLSTGGNLADPYTYIDAALTYGLLHGGRSAFRKIDTNVAHEVAKLLASNDPEVVKKAIVRVGRSPRLLRALRLGEGKLARALVPVVQKPGAGQAPAVAAGVQPANAGGDQEQGRRK